MIICFLFPVHIPIEESHDLTSCADSIGAERGCVGAVGDVLPVLARGGGRSIGGVGLSRIRTAAADGEPRPAVAAGPEPEVGVVADSLSVIGAVSGDAARRVHRRRRPRSVRSETAEQAAIAKSLKQNTKYYS